MILVLTTLASADTIESDPPTTAPAGISVEWSLDDCIAVAKVSNATSVPVVIDWNLSVIAAEGQAAIGAVPGDASKLSAMNGMQPTVVPPGSFARPYVFRKDRLPADNPVIRCTVDSWAPATVTLKLDTGWYVQRLKVISGPAAAPVPEPILRYTKLDVDKKGLHLVVSDGTQRNLSARGDEREVTFRKLHSAMELEGCNPKIFDEELLRWRSSRIFGNAFIWAGIGVFGYLSAGEHAYNAEKEFNTCMAPKQ